MLLATYLGAITDALQRRFRMPRWAGLSCALLGTTAVLVAAGMVIVPPVVDQIQALVSGLPGTITAAQEAFARLSRQYPLLRNSRLADPNSGIMLQALAEAANFLRGSLVPYLRAGGKLFVDGASVLVMAIYLARSPALYRDGVVSLVSPRYRGVAALVMRDIGQTLQAWVVGQLLDMLVLGVLVGLGLLVIGAPYWLAFGALSAIAAIVPFFGTFVSILLPALVVLGSGGWIKSIAVLALGVIVHLIEANFIQPYIMERKVSLPPVLTIASVLAAGALFGLIGLVVAVPILAVLLVLVHHVLHGVVYGESEEIVTAAVLHPTERRGGADRRGAGSAQVAVGSQS